jgi:MFS family permease
MSATSSTCCGSEPETEIYGRDFWLAYLANVLLVCANSLTFRFAEFIAALGDSRTEELSGRIIRWGLIAAIVARLWLGRAIDRYGTRRMWLLSSVLFLTGGATLLSIRELSPLVWFARIAYQVGLAGMFSCSIVHIQDQVPAHRRTEIIGSLGSSGFVGTIIGTQLSDLFFNWLPPGMPRFVAMFGGCTLLGVLHTIVVFILTRHDEHHSPAETPGAFRLLFRHWPGMVTLVAVAMGTSFSVTTVFLTRYATSLHLRGIGTFFFIYAVTAFCCRWLFRQSGETFGRHWMVLWGLGGLAVGQCLFLIVQADWQFIFPAVSCGFGHALLFPAVVSIGAGRFPIEYRGSGTTLVLGFTELGTAVSAPLLGRLIDLGNLSGEGLGFSYMFLTAGAVAALTGIVYTLTAARQPDRDLFHIEDRAAPIVDAGAIEEAGELVAVPGHSA